MRRKGQGKQPAAGGVNSGEAGKARLERRTPNLERRTSNYPMAPTTTLSLLRLAMEAQHDAKHLQREPEDAGQAG